MDLDSLRRKHGGYWRYSIVDFHYLFNQYFPPPELYAELQHAVLALANSYPSSQGVLAESLATWKNMASADDLVVGNGSSELIKILMDRVVTRIAVPLPTFNEFIVGPPARVHRYALDESSGFAFDVDRLLWEVAVSDCEYAVLVNPNNPVGNLISLADIRRVLDAGVRLIVDEAFMAFADPSHSAEQLVAEYDNLVVVTSLTKSIGVAGLRLGYVLTTSNHVKEQLRRALPIWNVNSLAEYVLEALPRYRAAHEQSLARIKADTQWFAAEIAEVDYLTPMPTSSNAVLCAVDGSGRRLAEILYDRHRFVVKEGIHQAEWSSKTSYVRLGVRNRADNSRLLAALHAIDGRDVQSAPRTASQAH